MRDHLLQWLETGTKDSNSEGLNNSIRIANFIGVLFTTVIGIPFIVVTFIYLRPLSWVPVAGTAMFLMVIAFNYTELYRLSRVVLCTVPLLLANIYSAYLLNAGQDLPQSLAFIIGSFVVMPMALFEWHDRKYAIALGIIGAAMMLLLPYYESWFQLDYPLDLSIFEAGPLRIIVSLMALTANSGMMLTLVYRNSVLENKWL
ncbi:MAG: hypothetical protein AAFQ98_08955 [Bacteroidota bacterium]